VYLEVAISDCNKVEDDFVTIISELSESNHLAVVINF